MAKIFRDLYISNCKKADIPLTRTELHILDKLVDEEEWFDPKLYQYVMDARTSIYLTKDQRQILDWMPTDEDDPFIASEKNWCLKHKIKDMKRANKA